jgi:hypothetical protein
MPGHRIVAQRIAAQLARSCALAAARQDFTFQRNVPKFLQKFSHLLPQTPAGGGSGGDDDGPTVVGNVDGKRHGLGHAGLVNRLA